MVRKKTNPHVGGKFEDPADIDPVIRFASKGYLPFSAVPTVRRVLRPRLAVIVDSGCADVRVA